jgi:hypothetical protein
MKGHSPFTEVLMTAPAMTMPVSPIPPEVRTFAIEKGVSLYLDAVIALARRAFPSSLPQISLGRDAEDETHQYIALDVEVGGKEVDELLAGQRVWSAGLSGVCPSRHAVYFVLGWR